MKKPRGDEFSEPRKRVERKPEKGGRRETPAAVDSDALIQEPKTRQVELEMQNEELRRARQELEDSRRQFADLYDFAPVGYFILDCDGVIRSSNFTGDRLLGYQKHGLANLPFATFVIQDDRGILFEHLREVFEKQVKQTCELRITAEGRSIRNVQLQTVLAREKKSLPASCRTALIDITERRKAEDALRKLNIMLEAKVAQRTVELQRRAQQLQKLALELTAAEDRQRKRISEILHEDLQQQLAAVRFNLDLLSSPARTGQSPQQIISTVNRILAEAIQTSRELSHELSPAVLHSGDLAEALRWLAADIKAKHGLPIHVNVSGQIRRQSEAIAMFAFRATQELLLNVIKHSRAAEARIQIKQFDGRIYLSISDRGCGFDPGDVGKSPGFGLLSIRERIELLGGQMHISSEPGKGSTIFIVLPDSEAVSGDGETAPVEHSPNSAAGPAGHRNGHLRLLVADDHAIVRQGLISLLRGHDKIEIVGEAADGREAVNLAHKLRPDVVIMDVSMPMMNGAEATAQIKTHLPATRVIALSMYNEPEIIKKMHDSGAESFVLKTAPSEELLDAIRGKP